MFLHGPTGFMGLKSNPRLGLLSPIHTLSHHPHPIENFQCIVASPTSRVVRFPFTQSQKMTFEVRRETVYNYSWSSTCQLKIFTLFLEMFERNVWSEGYVASFFVICQPLQSFEWSPDKSTMIHLKSSEGHSNLLSVFNTICNM